MTKKKLIAIVTAAVLVICCAVAGTLAWLTDTTPEVKNTFSPSNIDITLTETAGTTPAGGHEFKMVPGYTITKDPKVTVTAGSEECYLFVKLEKSTNFDSFLTYTIADGWTALTGVDGVYYRVVATADMGTAYSVLKDDQVTVLDSVTKEMMTETNFTNPTLTFTAYATQLYKNNNTTDNTFTPAEAWAKVTP